MRVGSVFPSAMLGCMVLMLAAGCSTGGDDNVSNTTLKVIGYDGGEIGLGHARLVIPRGALSEDTLFTMTIPTDYPQADRLLPGSVVDIGPSGTRFAVPATLFLAYDEEKLPEGVAEAHLRKSIHMGKGWSTVTDSTVSPDDDFVSARIDHLSLWGIAHLSAECIAWADQADNVNVEGYFDCDGDDPDSVECYMCQGVSKSQEDSCHNIMTDVQCEALCTSLGFPNWCNYVQAGSVPGCCNGTDMACMWLYEEVAPSCTCSSVYPWAGEEDPDNPDPECPLGQ